MSDPANEFRLPADFYDRYWQREPLVVRAALPGFRSPISPDELAGLACMAEVESRIVLESGGSTPWEVRYGPFMAQDFATLPETHWSLLVQAVDHWDGEIAHLTRLFPRIPSWRFDDVMVSYASDGGGAGPHVDQYDVFLLQGLGRRRWLLGGRPPPDAALREDTDLGLLVDFDAEAEVVLDPGDALYLPPGVAHHGIADGECITISIGFRAPALGEVIDEFGAYVAGRVDPSRRYTDPGTSPPVARGEITAAALQHLFDEVCAELTPGVFADWFGEFVTAAKYPEPETGRDEEIGPGILDDAVSVTPRNDARFAFIDTGGDLLLFVHGERYRCAPAARAFVDRLCAGETLTAEDLREHSELITTLINRGCLDIEG